MIKFYIVIFILLYTLNQVTFILYNYSLFSLLCSSYLLDITTKPQFFFSSYYGYEYTLSLFPESCQYSSYMTNSYLYIIDSCAWNLQNVLLNGIVTFTNTPIDSIVAYISDHIADHSLTKGLGADGAVYCVYFDTKILGTTNISFYILQNKLFIIPGETSLCFFRILNNSVNYYNAISIYTITPSDFNIFIHKIQCFCFEELLLRSYEILELPVLFYLDPTVIYLNNTFFNYDFCIEYILMVNR